MHKRLITYLLTLILICSGITSTYAAFPVPAKETTAVATNNTIPAKSTFKQTRSAKFISQLKSVIHAHTPLPGHNTKPGWPGIVSFVCGLLALASLFTVVPIFFLLAIAAIIFGAIGSSHRRYSNNGLALAGMILGIVEIVLVITIVALIVAAFT